MHWTNEQHGSYRSFSDAAERYCTFVESLLEGRPENFFKRLRFLLSRLVWVTENLRAKFIVTDRIETSDTLEISDDDDFEDAENRLIDNQSISDCLRELLSPEVERWTKITDEDYREEVDRVYMLFDDLADLYDDLRTGLEIARIAPERPEHEAVFHWLVQAEYHWGPHLYKALLTVQDIILESE